MKDFIRLKNKFINLQTVRDITVNPGGPYQSILVTFRSENSIEFLYSMEEADLFNNDANRIEDFYTEATDDAS